MTKTATTKRTAKAAAPKPATRTATQPSAKATPSTRTAKATKDTATKAATPKAPKAETFPVIPADVVTDVRNPLALTSENTKSYPFVTTPERAGRSKFKAYRFVAKVLATPSTRTNGYAAEVSRLTSGTVGVWLTPEDPKRGTVYVAWHYGVNVYGNPTVTYPDGRTVELRNASHALEYVGATTKGLALPSPDRKPRASKRAERPEAERSVPDALRKADASAADVAKAVIGKTISWRNSRKNEVESATVRKVTGWKAHPRTKAMILSFITDEDGKERNVNNKSLLDVR
jgi:hypothetical protein